MIAAARQFQEMIAEQSEYRELLYQMTLRDLLIRYKQTVMGFGWAVFMPLVNTLVFSVVFTRVARIETPVPYPIFAYCGFLTWNFFASSLRFGVASLTSNSNLVSKVYFPREVFPFSAVLVCLVDLAVGSILMAGFMAYYHIALSRAILFLPVVVIPNLAFTTGFALILAMGNLFYRDVKYLFEVVVMVWMFGTSVAYPIDSVGGWLGRILALNPMTQFIDAYRDVLLYGHLPPAGPFAVTSAASFAVLLFAWYVFHRSEFAFAENI